MDGEQIIDRASVGGVHTACVITYSLNTFATISSLSFEKNLLINPLIFTTVPLSPVKNCNNFAKTSKEFVICAVIQSIRSYKFHV